MEKQIQNVLKGIKRPMTKGEIAGKAKIPRTQNRELNRALDALVAQGILSEFKGRYRMSRRQDTVEGTIVKVTDRFGFATPDSGEKDIFIPGRDLLGAMPGDKVLLRLSKSSSGDLSEGEVTQITEEENPLFAGTIVLNEWGKIAVLPDQYVKFSIEVDKKSYIQCSEGDKVLARVSLRSQRHSGHRVEVDQVFGSSDKAYICAEAILAENNIETEFPEEVMDQAKAIATGVGIHPKELSARLDLRDKMIFTIDGADTKDIDDAISLERTKKGWELGVHIADVSYYVTSQSPLDQEAFKRGTSVYYADKVVPMLPAELSNGICSLNPDEDRLAFSAIVQLTTKGEVEGYRFEKTVIRSQIKGVYSEINNLFSDEKPEAEFLEKYATYMDTLKNMKDLAAIIGGNRRARNAMNLSSTESKIIVEDNIPVDIVARHQGVTENIIEEFMLTANEASALFAQKMKIPFIFRVHESPDPERVESLYQLLESLGVPYSRAKAGQSVAASLDGVLAQVKDTELEKIVNYSVLRTMAKAKYSPDNMGHFGLALNNYCHFTSPIRRYPDLAIHRIMSSLVTGMRRENIEKRFRSWVDICSSQSTSREIMSMTAERNAEDCYKAEYMSAFVDKEMDGVVSSVTGFGIFIELENTVEGLIHIDNFPTGRWEYDNLITYNNEVGGAKIRVGDHLKVRVTKTTVATGKIDFEFAEPELYGGKPEKNAGTPKPNNRVSPKAKDGRKRR